jgi:alpha-glucosidase
MTRAHLLPAHRCPPVCAGVLAVAWSLLVAPPRDAAAADYTLRSPSGGVVLIVSHDKSNALTFSVRSAGTTVVQRGALGITTSAGDFTGGGLTFIRQARQLVDETYKLPVGKRSTYRNHANQLELVFTKGKEPTELRLVLRAYEEGVAFRYALGGSGPLEITRETSTFPLVAAKVKYWGQEHPNNYGYETALGPVTAERISMPVLAELGDRKHFLFLAQAASYSSYVIPNYERKGNVLSVDFPLDQKEPVRTTLPFESPWRVVMVSPRDLSKIIESSLLENLNPPTEPSLASAPWIRPGRASWDFIAGEGNKLRNWIDFDVKMGWEYHFADAGWERRVPDMAEIAAYGKSKNVGIVVWGKVANKTSLNTRDRAEVWMASLAKMGVSGAKIDFFDQRDDTAEKTDDLEDTQQRLFVRDFLSEIAARHHLLVEYHGCAVPSGERRRWPHVMSAEAVYGLERRTQKVDHDLTIPYVRNMMGPVSYTPLHLERSAGSHSYQLGQIVLYETGIQIFAERHDRILGFEAVDFLKTVPVAWDDIRFIDGYPASHAIFARKKGASWYVAGITAEERTATIPLRFLDRGVSYKADVYRDGDTKTSIVKEQKTLTSKDTLRIAMRAAGGFVVQLNAPATTTPSP